MSWHEVRKHYPNRWILVEALKTHDENSKHIIDDLAVINAFSDSATAMDEYSKLHSQEPDRELYVLHTSRKILDIDQRKWLGIRSTA